MADQETIIDIPLNQIVVVSNTRTEFDQNALKELGLSIKTNGLIQAITVKPLPDGKYRLICGERRYRASLLIGAASIRAQVADIADKDILAVQIVENLQRRNVTVMDEIRSIVRLKDENAMTTPEIAKTIGKAVSHVDAQLRISRGCPELLEALGKNHVTRSVALVIAALDTPEKQKVATESLKRENPGFLVKKLDAEKWVQRSFGVQQKVQPGKHFQTTKTENAGRFAADWKYYLVRFNTDQFQQWQGIVRNRTETDVLAEAVEEVMLNAKSQQATA